MKNKLQNLMKNRIENLKKNIIKNINGKHNEDIMKNRIENCIVYHTRYLNLSKNIQNNQNIPNNQKHPKESKTSNSPLSFNIIIISITSLSLQVNYRYSVLILFS